MLFKSELLTALVVLNAIVSNATLCAQDVSATANLPRHAIVFAHHSDAARKDYDIWQIAADGTQMASVVVLPGHQAQFTISPDGDELIYVDRVDGNNDLWRRGFHGKDPVNLTNSRSNEGSPSWSPDGGRVLFSPDRDSEENEIYVLSLESGDVERLTSNQFYDSEGCWSPDGSKIIFTRFFPLSDNLKSKGQGAIFQLDLKTKVEIQLTDLSGYCGGLDYSPDGTKIAFHRSADATSEIWIMNSDGSGQQQITETYIDEYSPVWSPDNNWLVFTAGTGHDGLGTFDLWLMRPDGSERRVISAAGNTQMSPQWRYGDHYVR